MNKFFKIFVTTIILLVMTGCLGNEGTEDSGLENNNQTENGTTRIGDLENLPGVDPLIERYPNSVRSTCVAGSFCIYYAEATIQEVLDFYANIASENGNPFNHEVIPEDHPHWVNTYDDPANPRSGQFAFTLGEAENVCENCVEWVLYSVDWPE